MDKSLLPPAIIAICLDLQSLSDTVRYAWERPAAEGLPLSLSNRMTWTPRISAKHSEFQSGTVRPAARRSRFDPSPLGIMDVASAQDALELLRLLSFDVAVLGEQQLGDAVPPLLGEIKLVSPRTRCIVVTAAMDERRERAIRQAGVLAILDAPLPFAQLCDLAGRVAATR